MVRSDRRSVSFPMWRKKVDRTILNDNGCTVLPAWIVDNFGIRDKFGKGKNNPEKSKKSANSSKFENFGKNGFKHLQKLISAILLV